jgi:glutathione S-transferase
VRIFLAEKGIAVPTVQVDLRNGEQFTPEFRAINPDCTVPVLEFDGGTRIADMIGICRYFEEIQPQPPLMGVGAQDKAIVTSRQRQVERDGFYAVMEAFRNYTRAFKSRAITGPVAYEQIPELAERGRARVGYFFETANALLADNEFIAGPRYSIADITALVTIDFADRIKMTIPETCPHLRRWYDVVSARPSAKA